MKNSILVLGALLLSMAASAQVKFNLRYEEATKVYTVSLTPEVTFNSPHNMVSSGQIVLRVDADAAFTPGITSMVDGLVWADNAYLDYPADAPEYMFVCISLVNGPTTKIGLTADKEMPLFSFINVAGGCPGKVELLDNNDPMVQAVRATGYNVTQYLPVLGARGNAFSGILNSAVDCSSSSGTTTELQIIDEVLISPVPADKTITVQWTQLSDQHRLQQIVICDAKGSEILREKISEGKGKHTQHINVENWKAGMYRLRFVSEKSHQTKSWNLMVIH